MICPSQSWVTKLKVDDYVWLVAHNTKSKVLSIEEEYDDWNCDVEYTLKLELNNSFIIAIVDENGLDEFEYVILPLEHHTVVLQDKLNNLNDTISKLQNDIEKLKIRIETLENQDCSYYNNK